MRIVWSDVERQMQFSGYLLLLEADPYGLTMAWVRRNWLLSQRQIEASRKRQYSTPQELQALFERLQSSAYVLLQTQHMEKTLSARVADLESELRSLRGRLREYEVRAGRPVFDILDAAVRGYTKPKEKTVTEAAPKARRTAIVIAGVHDKHHDQIERDHPYYDIMWLPQNASLTEIKRAASGRGSVILQQGVNPATMNAIRNCAALTHVSHGLSGIDQFLATRRF